MTSNPLLIHTTLQCRASLANEESIDISFTLTANAPAESSWAADNKNEGYRFMGWYASQQVQVNDIDPIHSKFTQPDEDLKTQDTGLTAEDSKYQIGTKDNYQEPDYKLTVNKPDTDESSEPTDYADNNLYVAYVQAQVLLHDKSGAVINKDGTTTNAGDTDDDWYDYEGTITLPSRVESDKVGENATLVGWTTRPNTASGSCIRIRRYYLYRLAEAQRRWSFLAGGRSVCCYRAKQLVPRVYRL